MFKKLIGIALIIAAFVVEAMWLGAAFGSVIVGVVLLIFAPAILILPWQILFAMGVAFLTYEDNAYTGSGYDDHYRNSYSDYSYDSDYTDDSAHDTYEEEHYTSSYQQQSSLQTYYDILGCSPEDDFSTIKKAYKKLSMKFHPDAIEGKGLDSEFIKFATEKMKEINEAYMKIKAVKYAT